MIIIFRKGHDPHSLFLQNEKRLQGSCIGITPSNYTNTLEKYEPEHNKD
jgi:hypothetical protein